MKSFFIFLVISISLSVQGQFNYHQKIDFAEDLDRINIADYNLDGYNDILTTTYDWRNDIYFNDGAGNFYDTNTIIIDGPGLSPNLSRSNDIDNDGDIDIIFTGIFGGLHWSENNNDSTFNNFVTISNSGSFLQVEDIDNNGILDIVTSNIYPLMRHINNSSTQFTNDTISNNNYYSQFIIADITSNGFGDIITSGGTAFINNLGVYGNSIDITNGTTCGNVLAEDIDYDNDIDIITYYSDTIKYLKNDGLGNFNTTALITTTNSTIKSVDICDLDNDGVKDILCSSDSIFWFKNDGFGNFSLQATVSTFLNPSFLNTRDLNNDGMIDIVAQGTDYWGGDSTAIFLNNFNSIYYHHPIINVCSGDSALVFGSHQNIPGFYFDTLTTTQNQDSIIVQQLLSVPNYLISDSQSICQGDSLLIYGIYQNTTGVYYDSLQTVNGCDSILSTVLTVDICSGINNLNNKFKILIYPNPTSNQLTIDTEQNISQINIIDITGKIIKVSTKNTRTINVDDLSNGIYFIQLVTADETIIKKFVKQ